MRIVKQIIFLEKEEAEKCYLVQVQDLPIYCCADGAVLVPRISQYSFYWEALKEGDAAFNELRKKFEEVMG